MSRNWEHIYETRQDHPWTGSESCERITAPLIEKYDPKPLRALDVGCGEGDKSRWLAQRGFETIGIDISKKAIATAQELNADSESQVRYVNGNLANLSQLDVEGPFGLILDRASSQFLSVDEQSEYWTTIADLLGHHGFMQYEALELVGEDAPDLVQSLALDKKDLITLLAGRFRIAEEYSRSSRHLPDTNVYGLVLSPA
ncbi:MAG: class I SAM-dependent methyltransferase [Patescibacteria group bacterium]